MKVELSLYAVQLKNVAGALKGTSDPFAVVTTLATQPGEKAQVLGKTEAIHNTLSPQWVKTFLIDFELGKPYKVCISIFDEEKKGSHKSMGSAVFEVGELLGARGNTKAKKLNQGGTLFASVRKAVGSGVLRLQIKGKGLKNVEGMFSKSDPFYELSRKIDSAGGLTWDNVFRSKSIRNNLNPDWEAAAIELSTLCGGDLDLPIKISVFDFESSGKHVPMGSCEVTVNTLQKSATSNESIKLLEKGKDVGTLTIVKAEVSGVVNDLANKMATSATISTPSVPPPSHMATAAAVAVTGTPDFVDYISGGCELNVVVAIDFTGSNGDPRKPGTLHYIDANSMNDYEKAISAIVGILEKYDTDQMYPVLGFGAKYQGVVKHCFQVGNAQEVRGVKGILDAYNNVFKTGLILSAPTIFDEVIDTAAARAQSSFDAAKRAGKQSYTILLIVTDGAVSDPASAARTLDRASDAPLSVVIVGVGNADFSSMQFLDDSNPPGRRDIAQFVQFNKHSYNPTALTSETLNEVPTQLTRYFQSKGIQPLPPIQRSNSSINVGEAEAEIDLSLDITEEEIVVKSGGDDFVSGFGNARYSA